MNKSPRKAAEETQETPKWDVKETFNRKVLNKYFKSKPLSKHWINEQRARRLQFRRDVVRNNVSEINDEYQNKYYKTNWANNSCTNACKSLSSNHISILDKSSFLGKSKSATGINTHERPSTSLQQKFSLKRQKVIKEYIKRQDITLAREVPYPSLHKLKK
jgi:hypothetical protein